MDSDSLNSATQLNVSNEELGNDSPVEAETPSASSSPFTTPSSSDKIIHSVDSKGTTSKELRPMKISMAVMVGLCVAVVGAGAATGWGIHRLRAGNRLFTSNQPLEAVPSGTIKPGDIFGAQQTAIFKDAAEGVLQIGGIQGEGTHKLVRPGGISQTVYLVSSVTDLDKFENMKIKVWGETFAGEKAGWLMDVGRVEIEELNATLPQ